MSPHSVAAKEKREAKGYSSGSACAAHSERVHAWLLLGASGRRRGGIYHDSLIAKGGGKLLAFLPLLPNFPGVVVSSEASSPSPSP